MASGPVSRYCRPPTRNVGDKPKKKIQARKREKKKIRATKKEEGNAEGVHCKKQTNKQTKQKHFRINKWHKIFVASLKYPLSRHLSLKPFSMLVPRVFAHWVASWNKLHQVIGHSKFRGWYEHSTIENPRRNPAQWCHYSQLSRKRPPLVHDKVVAYGRWSLMRRINKIRKTELIN